MFLEMIKHDIISENKRFVVTANPEIFMNSKNDADVQRLLLDESTCVVPDGISIVKACKKMGIPVKERITGIDIANYLIKEGYRLGASFYLFGSKKNVIQSLINKLEISFPNINIVGFSDGYINEKDQVFDEISYLKPDICLVALGVPQQEKLIYRHIGRFNKGIFVGIGGAFDVISGEKKRAPNVFIRFNLEWLYRIIREPKRLKRFFSYNLKFIIFVLLNR